MLRLADAVNICMDEKQYTEYIDQNPKRKALLQPVYITLKEFKVNLQAELDKVSHIKKKKEFSTITKDFRYRRLLFSIFKNVDPFEYFKSLRFKDKINYLNLDEEAFRSLQTVKIHQYFRFGCPWSTDVDLACVVNKREDVYLIPDLSEVKYDGDLDVGLIYIENGQVKETSKGYAMLTNNILYNTYKFHPQFFPCPITEPCELDLERMVISCCKYILDNMETLLQNQYDEAKRIAYYKIYDSYLRVEKVSAIDLPIIGKSYKWKSAMKSTVLKMLQCIYFSQGIELYTKEELANKDLGLLWYLTRGTQGEFNPKTLPILQESFRKISINSDIWVPFQLEQKENPLSLPPVMFREFLKSPLKATALFMEEFPNYCSTGSKMNDVFALPSFGVEYLDKKFVEEHVFMYDQRSKEWVKDREFYICGSQKKVEQDDIQIIMQDMFYLIRGCITELMVINSDFRQLFNTKNVQKASVGLLVEKKGVPSRGIAPDLLLISEKKIFPVEIKCIPVLSNNLKESGTWRRAVTLAKKQVKTAMKICGSDAGIVIIVFAEENYLSAKATFIRNM